jgi:hypothetical protein
MRYLWANFLGDELMAIFVPPVELIENVLGTVKDALGMLDRSVTSAVGRVFPHAAGASDS